MNLSASLCQRTGTAWFVHVAVRQHVDAHCPPAVNPAMQYVKKNQSSPHRYRHRGIAQVITEREYLLIKKRGATGIRTPDPLLAKQVL